jgi:deoxyinosine 3'endonuclease (endonuclease V)
MGKINNPAYYSFRVCPSYYCTVLPNLDYNMGETAQFAAVNHLEEQLEAWKAEQLKVAAQVVVKEHDATYDDPLCPGFVAVPPTFKGHSFFGGVDVSFPETETDQSVATYVIIDRTSFQIVYQDCTYFDLTVPYVSSFLSFREIGPIENLIQKQMKERPELTPSVILVDGNGILHTRRAGIACFVGVRMGIPTIGVAKSLYYEDGIDRDLVRVGLDQALLDLQKKLSTNDKLRSHLGEPTASDPSAVPSASQRPVLVNTSIVSPISGMSITNEPLDRRPILQELAPLCNGVAIKLGAACGTVLGCALVGHGGRISANSGTKNAIFISVGHNISLLDAVSLCAELSQARIPEPVRQADLWGRDLLRNRSE